MVLKKRKKIIFIFLAIALLFCAFVIVLNLVKGPTINVVNCNSDVITNSRVCFNSSSTYYYLDSNNFICSVADGNKSEIFYDDREFKYITCNSDYIFAADDESIFQFNSDGKLLKSISSDTNDRIYGRISGIFATDDCVFCGMLGSYLLLDPITLGNMSIKELIGDNEWRSIGDAEIGSVKTASNGGIKMIIAYPIELDKDTFSGSIVVDDKQIINLGGYNYIVGDTGNACMEYKAHNGTIFKNLYNGKEYNTPKTDIRHFSLTEDSLITFSSSYDKKSVLMDLCILYDNYSVRDYGLYNNYPLQFHKYDQITLIDLKTDSEKIIKTRSGEKIIYLSNKKAVSFYKGKYLFYDIKNWENYKSIDADEINSHGCYTFESCDDYVFVFDDNSGNLLNSIDVS